MPNKFDHDAWEDARDERVGVREKNEEMEHITIRLKRLHENAVIPQYAHGPDEDAGMDLCAIEETILVPGVPTPVRTGISIELPRGFEAQIRGRSGLGLKHGIRIVQGVGTIDPSYRGEIKGLFVWDGYRPNCFEVPDGYLNDRFFVFGGENRAQRTPVPRYTETQDIRIVREDVMIGFVKSGEPRYRISPGDRICQMIIGRYAAVDILESTELTETTRAADGFGSTGQ